MNYFAEARLSKKIEYQNFSVSWLTYRNVKISFHNLKVSDPKIKDPIFEAGKVQLELDIGEIPFGVLAVNQIFIMEPLIRLKTESLVNNGNDGFDQNIVELFLGASQVS